jgi:hypothetical protein
MGMCGWPSKIRRWIYSPRHGLLRRPAAYKDIPLLFRSHRPRRQPYEQTGQDVHRNRQNGVQLRLGSCLVSLPKCGMQPESCSVVHSRQNRLTEVRRLTVCKSISIHLDRNLHICQMIRLRLGSSANLPGKARRHAMGTLSSTVERASQAKSVSWSLLRDSLSRLEKSLLPPT